MNSGKVESLAAESLKLNSALVSARVKSLSSTGSELSRLKCWHCTGEVVTALWRCPVLPRLVPGSSSLHFPSGVFFFFLTTDPNCPFVLLFSDERIRSMAALWLEHDLVTSASFRPPTSFHRTSSCPGPRPSLSLVSCDFLRSPCRRVVRRPYGFSSAPPPAPSPPPPPPPPPPPALRPPPAPSAPSAAS